MTFAGACYNGPYFGKNLCRRAPYFHVALYEPALLWREADPEAPAEPLDIRYGCYVWNDDYGCWVWVGP